MKAKKRHMLTVVIIAVVVLSMVLLGATSLSNMDLEPEEEPEPELTRVDFYELTVEELEELNKTLDKLLEARTNEKSD